jgi:transcriptional regulator with XRE-family HTH domain
MPSMPRPSTIDPKLAAALRALRERAGLSQEDLAHEADLTTGAVSRIERAKMNPSWTTLQRILVALKASLADLQAAIERSTPS